MSGSATQGIQFMGRNGVKRATVRDTRDAAPKVTKTGQSYAAVDLGTNSCRLLVAVPGETGFHVVDGYSRVVRLGERVAETGLLDNDAMERTIVALAQCAERIGRRSTSSVRAVATEACRKAENVDPFISRVKQETGIALEVIDPCEEAALTVAGCGELLRSGYDHALVFDIGGGSTEVSWVRTPRGGPAELLDCISLPFGVVSLRDEFGPEALPAAVFKGLLDRIDDALKPFDARNGISQAVAANKVRMIGTSGTVTTLGAMYLNLPRYNRSRVDGLEIRFDSIRQISAKLARMSSQQRIAHPCLGYGRGDLMLMGLAVLRAVCNRWPTGKLRIADRGIREGLLAELMAADGFDNFGPRLIRNSF